MISQPPVTELDAILEQTVLSMQIWQELTVDLHILLLVGTPQVRISVLFQKLIMSVIPVVFVNKHQIYV